VHYRIMPDMSTIRRFIPLRILRWKIQLRNMPLAKFWGIAIGATVLCVPLWRHFGTDIALPVLADATPILLAIVGVVMSYIQPRRESHRATTFILIVAGLLGSAVLSANRIRSEASHRNEVSNLGSKMDEVRHQNDVLSAFLLAARNTGKMSEVDRRKGIETVLRNEYILSHDPIDPEILAGNKMPPQEWTNGRLKAMGEDWKVAEVKAAPTVVQQAPEPEKARLVFSLWDATASVDHPVLSKFVHPNSDGSYTVEFSVGNASEVTAESVDLWLRVCDACSFVTIPNRGIYLTPPTPRCSVRDHDRGLPEDVAGIGTPI